MPTATTFTTGSPAFQETMQRKYALAARGVDLDQLVRAVAKLLEMTPDEVLAPGKVRQRVQARSLLCYWAVRELNLTMTVLSQKLGLSVVSVSLAVHRGEQMAREKHYSLKDLMKL